MAAYKEINKFYIFLKKDIALFFNSFVSLGSIFGFAFLCVVLSTFTLGSVILPNHDRGVLAQAACWLCFVFSTIYVFSKSIESEKADQAIEMVLLSDFSMSSFFLAKWMATTFVVTCLEILVCVLFEAFFSAGFLTHFYALIFVFILSSSAISAIGILFSAMSSYLRQQEVSLPILVFPLSIPVLFSGVELSRALINDGKLDFFWLTVLIVINSISLSLSWLLFERVIRN